MDDLQGLWTRYGRERLAAALEGGPPLTITHAAVGDGGGTIPTVDETMTALVRTVWRGPVNSVAVSELDRTDLVVSLVLPPDIGGFWIREWGVYDETGALVALGPHDEMHKPLVALGQAVEIVERFHLPIVNAASVNLTVSSEVYVTADELDKLALVPWGLTVDDRGHLIVTRGTRGQVFRAADYDDVAVLPLGTVWGLDNDTSTLTITLP